MTPTSPGREGDIRLGAGLEFDAIRAMLARWGDTASGVGDDAAVVDLPRGDRLVASVDTSIEGRHFREGWLTPREIGYRSVVAALSDLAAMGAIPRGILISLAIPERWQERLYDVADGIGSAARLAGAPIVGGNTSRAGELSITTTVLGSAYDVLRRDAIRPGDLLYVTGALGASRAALEACERGETPIAEHRRRFAEPEPRLREAIWLRDRGARAAIDISDGLVADLGHLAAASGMLLEINVDDVPCANGVSVEMALRSGEEYELVVASPVALDTEEFRGTFGIPLSLLGSARREATPGEVLLIRGGVRVANPAGHDHLS